MTTFEVKSDFERPVEYYKDIKMPPLEEFRDWLRFKDQSTAMFDKRWQEAKAVIDGIARYLGIDTEVRGLCLYGPEDAEGNSEILRRIENWFDHSGDKVRMKKRISELEQENAYLKSLIAIRNPA